MSMTRPQLTTIDVQFLAKSMSPWNISFSPLKLYFSMKYITSLKRKSNFDLVLCFQDESIMSLDVVFDFMFLDLTFFIDDN